MNASPLWPIVIGSLLAIGCLAGAYFNWYRKRIIDDLPTSKTQGVFIGETELKGTAESENPFTSYLGAVKCVHYRWQVEEQWRRIVTTTHTDAKGHSHTSTHTQTGWTRIAYGGESGPFYLKDDTGVIRIVPEHARIEGNQVFSETVSPNDPLYYGKCAGGDIANSTHRRRFHETAIPLHTMLYVLGQARERENIVAAEIAEGKNSSMFIISTRTEKQVSRGYGFRTWLFIILGLAIAIGGGAGWAVLTRGQASAIDWHPFVIMVGGYVAVMALAWLWTVYNSLINLNHRVDQGWSQVEVQLKRRHDLIPNLVQAVEGYRQHESETQTVIAGLRRQIEATPPGKTGPDFQGIAPLLRGVIERYPELKANQSFLKLQEALVDTEQRIALARDYYNDIATFYNTRLDIVPDRWVAALVGRRHRVLMTATDFERASVKVSLAE